MVVYVGYVTTVARHKFSARLSEILEPYTPSALLVAQEVELELFEAHGQRCVQE